MYDGISRTSLTLAMDDCSQCNNYNQDIYSIKIRFPLVLLYTSFKLGRRILTFIRETHYGSRANPFPILITCTLNYTLIL